MQKRSPGEWLPAVAFVLGVSSFSFAYGVAVGVYEYFPYALLRDAAAAAFALKEKYALAYEVAPDPYVYAVEHDRTGVTVHDPERAFPGHTFLAMYRDGQHKAVLMDMSGKVVHEWHVPFSEVWPEAPHIIEQAEDDLIHWHGAHLFPNGDVLFNFESGNFPRGGGLVKLDKDSHVLWALPRNTHHDLHVQEDGTIYVASQNYRTEAVPGIPYFEPPYLEDTVLRVSPNGEVLDEISILEALQGSAYRGLLSIRYAGRVDHGGSRDDPTHLNTVEVLPAPWDDRFPLFEAGDILVSLRNINTIAVIDPATRLVKWAMSGKFVRQHDPDFLPNGNILIYDNLGADKGPEASQIIEIDPLSQEIVWKYKGSNQRPFFSLLRGKQQPLPNGNVLIVEPEGGRAFEVTKNDPPEIVWEYYNALPAEKNERRVGLITLARRYKQDALRFLK